MIPPFDQNGQLPPGIHPALLHEIVARFGHGSDEREACSQSLQWLIPMCRRAGIINLYVNGSFVTNKERPADVDCVLVPGPAFSMDADATLAIRIGLPYLSLQIVLSDEERDFYLNDAFATDRRGRPKGIVEVML